MARMFRLGAAAVVATDDKATELVFVIPDSGVIITQATIMGLDENAEPRTVEIVDVSVRDTISVERFKGKRIPGKIAGNSKLIVFAKCPGALAISLTLACTERRLPNEGNANDLIDQDAEAGGDNGDVVTGGPS